MESDPNCTAPKTQKALALTRLGRCKEAAAIYEELLERMDDLAPKWRLSTRHQAAECYRRLAEQNEKMKDDSLVKEHLNRACRIIEEGWGARDSDERISALYAEVIENAICYAMHRADEAYAVECLERVSDASSATKIADFKFLTFERFERSFGENSSSVIRATQLSESIGWAEEKPGAGKTLAAKHSQGTIKVLPPNVPYGFITDLECRDWFFHKTAITGENTLSALRVGQSVRFIEDGDEKGRRFASRVEASN
jgi:cold shock CspA family protein